MSNKTTEFILNSLLTTGENSSLFKKRLTPFIKTNKLERAPINPKYFDELNKKHGIVITDKVYEVLMVIDSYNQKHKKEVPFVLYGKENDFGVIIFNDIDCDFNKLKDDYATFDNIQEYLLLKIRRFSIEKSKNNVICIGHTHPFDGTKTSFNYSFTDLIFHINFLRFDIFLNKKYNNKLFSLMKSVSVDFNFIYFDLQKNKFLKATKVLHKKDKKDYVPLSTFNYCDD